MRWPFQTHPSVPGNSPELAFMQDGHTHDWAVRGFVAASRDSGHSANCSVIFAPQWAQMTCSLAASEGATVESDSSAFALRSLRSRLRRDFIQGLRQSRQSSCAIEHERRRMAVRQGFEPWVQV